MIESFEDATRRPALGALLVLALGSCDARPPVEEGPPAALAERPSERVDTVSLEGMPEPMRLRLYRTPADFPLPFSTYVPEDMRPEVLEADSGASVRFVAEFGGRRNELAYLNLYVYPEGRSVDDALVAARAFAESRGAPVSRGEGDEEPQRPRRWEWSLAEHPFDDESRVGGPRVGVIAVGSHAGRAFHVIEQHPPEYGDGFGARAEVVLEELRWEDTGVGLR